MKNTYLEKNDLRKLTYTGLMTALVLLVTLVIKIPVPFTNGYIHLGDSMVFLSAILLGWKYGAFAAGAGSALADIIGGYAHWAIPTLIIKTLMAIIVAICANEKCRKRTYVFLSIVFAGGFAIFNIILKNILTSKIVANSTYITSDLLKELDVDTTQELFVLSNKVETSLLIITILIPILILVLSLLISKLNGIKLNASYTFGFVISGTFMVICYYIASYILTGNYVVPIFSIPLNMIQFIVGLVIAQLIAIGLKKNNISIPLQ